MQKNEPRMMLRAFFLCFNCPDAFFFLSLPPSLSPPAPEVALSPSSSFLGN